LIFWGVRRWRVLRKSLIFQAGLARCLTMGGELLGGGELVGGFGLIVEGQEFAEVAR